MSIESIDEYVTPSDSPSKYTKKILDKCTGAFFFIASMAKAISYTLPPLMPFFLLSSALCYFAGYSFWLAASFFAPSKTPKFDEWYGFAEFKEQSGSAAFLGITAALIALAALVFPSLAIPAAWAFFASNTFWVISEYHKLKNPHPDDIDTISKQKSYLYYCICIATIGLVSAAALTLVAFFPPLAFPLFIISASVNVTAGISAFAFWCDYNFGGTPNNLNIQQKSSYQTLISGLELTTLSSSKTPKAQEEKECYSYSPLFSQSSISSENNEQTLAQQFQDHFNP